MKRYTGKSLDEVLNSIASEQNVEVADITYTVIEEEKHLFGIGNSVTIEAYTINDIKEFIFEYLGNYFTELNQTVSIEIAVVKDEENGNDIFKVILDAENNAVIIGKNGQTLRAITVVLRAATNATFKKRVTIHVDVNDYKEGRYKKLRKLAQRIAREVVKTKVDVDLDPMPNDERKCIHQYLQDMDHIFTVSYGEGAKRHLVIKYSKRGD